MNTEKKGYTGADLPQNALDMQSIEKLACRLVARAEMERRGFVHVSSEDIDLTGTQQTDLNMVRAYFDGLPLDAYDAESSRYRRYSKFYMLPFAGLLIPSTAGVSYSQGAEFNDEVGALERKFEPISDSVLSCGLIGTLIKYDFDNSPVDTSLLAAPIEVGVHFIRLRAEIGKPGVAVPNKLHKDGEPYTWIHLVNRAGVSGGANIITDNTQQNTLCHTTLDGLLDSIGIVDSQVWHQVQPVYVEPGADNGYRDVILIDFTPMVAKPNAPVSLAA